MKTSKRITAILLCAIMVLGNIAVGGEGIAGVLDTFSVKASAAKSGTFGLRIDWELSDDGVLTISGTGVMRDIHNYSSNAPWNDFCSEIKAVVICDGVTDIGWGVFSDCTYLESVTIPNTVTSIDMNAFSHCTGLTNITIPNSVTSIGDGAFFHCTGLKSVTILDGVTSIGFSAFAGCTSLTSITIPDSLKSIGGLAFHCCNGLTDITVANGNTVYDSRNNCNAIIETSTNTLKIGCENTIIPDSVTSIDDYAFYGCSGLTSITIPNSVTSIGYSALFDCTGLTSITIPDSVTSIDDYAFYGCSGLTSITIPNSVTSIGKDAFSSCTGLTSITISDSVTSIEESAFSTCSGLTSITVDSNNPEYSSDEFGVLFNKDRTEILQYPGGNERILYEIPDTVTSIGNEAFSCCAGLTSITIPDSVISIGNEAFIGCTGLTSITIPEGIKSIGDYAFSSCTGLTSITIPEGVTSIGRRAFYNCTNLTSITIQEGITSIGHFMFSGCTGLTSITIPDSVTSIGQNAFSGCTGITSITIPKGVTSIYSYAFSGCTGLTSISIPEGIKSIGDYAFSGCTGLTSITIPDSVTSIGEEAFYGCTSLKSAGSIGSGCDYEFGWTEIIPTNAFSCCSGLTSITIPASVTSIGDYAFRDCAGLISITIPNSVTSIGKDAFSSCTGLTSITIPDSVTSIGNWAFYGCTGLKSAGPIGSGCDYEFGWTNIIPDGAFNGFSELTSITIPDSVKSIGEYAFLNCGSLTSVTIGNGLKGIGFGAFFFCSNLLDITIPDTVTEIGDYAFYNVPNICYSENMKATGSPWGALRVNNYFDGNCLYPDSSMTELIRCSRAASGELTVPDSVGKIDGSAFSGCCKIKDLRIPASVESIGQDAFKGVCNVSYRGKAEGAPWGAAVINGFIEKHDGYFMVYDSRARNVLYGCSVEASGTVTIPDSVKVIESDAFRGCSEITEIVIKMDDGIEPVIKDNAFSGCTKLESIRYEGGETVVTSHQVIFGDNGTRLIFVNKNYSGENKDGKYEIPDGVKIIEDNAFYNCRDLSEITVPDSVVSVGSHAFDNTAEKSKITITDSDENNYTCIGNVLLKVSSGENTKFVIPDTITCIAAEAFKGCPELASVTIPESVKGIGHNAFDGCYELDKIQADCDLLGFVGKAAFDSTGYFTDDANWDPAALYIGSALVSVKPEASGELVIRDGTKCIAEKALSGCGISGVSIPGSVTSVGTDVFENCSNLKNVEIGENVSFIGSNAFFGCDSLESIDVAEKNEVYKSVDGVLFTKDGADLIRYPAGKANTEYKVPDGTQSIENYAFAHCSNLEKIAIDDSVRHTSVAFFRCYADRTDGLSTVIGSGVVLEQVSPEDIAEDGSYKVPDGVLTVYPEAFCSDEVKSKVRAVDLNGAKYISRDAFAGCTKLESVTGLENVLTVGEGAFSGCTSLTEADLSSAVYIGSRAFTGCTGLTRENVSVPDDAVISDDAFDFEIERPGIDIKGDVTEVDYDGAVTLSIDAGKAIDIVWVNADTGMYLGTEAEITVENIKSDTCIVVYEIQDDEIIRESAAFAVKVKPETIPIQTFEIKDESGESVTSLSASFGDIIELGIGGLSTEADITWYFNDEKISEGDECSFVAAIPGKLYAMALANDGRTYRTEDIAVEVSNPGIGGRLDFSEEEIECPDSVTVMLTSDSGKRLSAYFDIVWYDESGEKIGEGVSHVYEKPTETFGFGVRIFDKVMGKLIYDLGQYTVNIKGKEVVITKDAKVPSFGIIDPIGYNDKVRITAAAEDIPEGYSLALFDGTVRLAEKERSSDGKAEISYTSGNLKANKTYMLRVIDRNGNVLENDNGKAAESQIDVPVKTNFFAKIIGFFRLLFKAIQTIDISAKPKYQK